MRNSVFALFGLFALTVLAFSGVSFMGHSLALAAPAPTHPFPQDFQWRVATAAHQIEGGNTRSGWWDEEKIPGNIKHGDTAAVATDS